MALSFKSVDKGWERLKAAALALRDRNMYAKIGVLDDGSGSEVRDGGLTTAQLAAVHEFGTKDGRIPARPFVGASFDKNLPRYTDEMRKLVKGIYIGKLTAHRLLDIMGARVASDIKRYVTSGPGVPPPNAPSTLKRKLARTRPGAKGGVRTLIDTGRMIGAITWSVVR